MIKIAPSILSADLAGLGKEIINLEEAGADWIHIDVMDGRFVPVLTFGAPVVAAVRSVTGLLLDCHLMVDNPAVFIDDFAAAGADIITVHAETDKHLHRLLTTIKHKKNFAGRQLLAGLALNPATPLNAAEELLKEADLILIMSVNPGFAGQKFIESSLDKIARLKENLVKTGSGALIQVDGGVNAQTAPALRKAGADVLVAGSAVFGAPDMKAAVKAIRG